MPRRKKLPLELRFHEDGSLDEVVCAQAYFHFEQMDLNHWWFVVTDEKTGKSVNVWLHAKGKITAAFEEFTQS